MTSKAFLATAILMTSTACTPPEDPSTFPVSSASYPEVNAEVGCESSYSDDKKDDLFREKYRNHWLTWKGEVVLAEAGEVSLNLDGAGTQDLQVDFEDKRAGYEVRKGEQMAVRFVMKTAGGCFLPFSGEHGVIQ